MRWVWGLSSWAWWGRWPQDRKDRNRAAFCPFCRRRWSGWRLWSTSRWRVSSSLPRPSPGGACGRQYSSSILWSILRHRPILPAPNSSAPIPTTAAPGDAIRCLRFSEATLTYYQVNSINFNWHFNFISFISIFNQFRSLISLGPSKSVSVDFWDPSWDPFGILYGILHGILFGILYGILFGILHGIH